MGEQELVPLSSIKVGDSARSESTVEPWMLLYFAAVSGDWNPAHMHKNGVKPFDGPIAHGLITGSFVSALLASKLPGPGSIYRSQSFMFSKPVLIGDRITTEVRVTKVVPDKRLISLDCSSYNQRTERVLYGQAEIYKKV